LFKLVFIRQPYIHVSDEHAASACGKYE
jgi:hypothetical protein